MCQSLIFSNIEAIVMLINALSPAQKANCSLAAEIHVIKLQVLCSSNHVISFI